MPKPSYYCYTCLKKIGRKKGRLLKGKCDVCGGEVRKLKSARSRAQVVTRLARHRGLRPAGRKPTRYEIYLQSPLWKEIRLRILERDKYICRDCGKKANQVHHLSYAHDVMAGKDDSKLISICRACHDVYHPDKIRRRRKTSASVEQPQIGNEQG